MVRGRPCYRVRRPRHRSVDLHRRDNLDDRCVRAQRLKRRPRSFWVDNTPTSPHYGRMYVSWNDFAVSGGALYATYSDNGTTWTPVRVEPSATFIRDVELTGGPDGTVFIAGMDEGGGGAAKPHQLHVQLNERRSDMDKGGDGPLFAPPGDALCARSSYFYMISPIWRHMGSGQPAVGAGRIRALCVRGAARP